MQSSGLVNAKSRSSQTLNEVPSEVGCSESGSIQLSHFTESMKKAFNCYEFTTEAKLQSAESSTWLTAEDNYTITTGRY